MHILPWFVMPAAVQEPIVTDRPDFTESAIVVPLRSLQIESGATREWQDRNWRLGLPELLLRYGNSDRWELRLGAPNHFVTREDSTTTRGWGDLYLGAKHQTGPSSSGVDTAWIFFTTLPTGDAVEGAEGHEPGASFCISKDLDDRYSVSGMASASFPSDDRKRPSFLGTLSLGIGLSERTAAFVEFAGSFRRQERPSHVLHAGLVYQPRPNEQWDVHFGVEPWTVGRPVFVAFGYSVRVDSGRG